MKTQTRSEHGITITEQLPDDGYVIIDSYHPHSCPWDYYGMRHHREYNHVLSASGITAQLLREHHEINAPTGSGPNGAVRFGDNMMPGVYHIAVPAADVERANESIAAHKKAIRAWLDEGALMPEACRSY